MPHFSDDSIHTASKGEMARIKHIASRKHDEREARAALINLNVDTSFPLTGIFSSKRAEQPYRRHVAGAFGRGFKPFEPS